jgi:Fe-S oxidoreductase
MERVTGFSAKRALPAWQRSVFKALAQGTAPHPRIKSGAGSDPLSANERGEGAREVALFADTFNTYFEPDNLTDAVEVLQRLGYRVTVPKPVVGTRPLCCGRTFLAAGLVDQARAEGRRLIAAYQPLVDCGVPVVGLEPSCLLTLRDEALALGLGDDAKRMADKAVLLEEFIAGEIAAGRIKGPIGKLDGKAVLHGHCHQKSFGIMPAIAKTLSAVEGLEVETIESSCCGMAGAFGYGADTHETSMAMAELSLLPAVRKATPDTIVIADGFSCRHQIADGAGREALHVARILRRATDGATEPVASGT